MRYIQGYAYSNEKEVIYYVAEMVPLICLTVIMDSLQGVLSGIARGTGWQHVGAYVNLGSFYLVGIPVALLLGFYLHLRGKVLWIGIVLGSTIQSALLGFITSSKNWHHQVIKAKQRVDLQQRAKKTVIVTESLIFTHYDCLVAGKTPVKAHFSRGETVLLRVARILQEKASFWTFGRIFAWGPRYMVETKQMWTFGGCKMFAFWVVFTATKRIHHFASWVA